MRTEKILADYLREVRHSVVNEFATLACVLGRARLGRLPEPEKIKRHEEAIRKISQGLLFEDLGRMLELLNHQVRQDRKAVTRRYMRRYGLQPKGNGT